MLLIFLQGKEDCSPTLSLYYSPKQDKKHQNRKAIVDYAHINKLESARYCSKLPPNQGVAIRMFTSSSETFA